MIIKTNFTELNEQYDYNTPLIGLCVCVCGSLMTFQDDDDLQVLGAQRLG